MMINQLIFSLSALLTLSACGAKLNKSEPTADSASLEEAWQAYYEALGEVTENFKNSDSYMIDEAHRAGTYEMIQSVIAANVLGTMKGGNGNYPFMRTMLSPSIKFGVDNPDTFYRASNISNPGGEYVYRVWGNRGTSSDFLLEIFDGPDPNGAISVFEDEELKTDEGGNFEVFISAEPQGENWMKLDATDNVLVLIIRDSHTNWDTEITSTVNIERIGTAGVPSPNLTEAQLIQQIHQARKIMVQQGQFWPDFSSKLRLLGKNNFTKWRASASLGIISQYYSAGFFSIEDDEAVIITLEDVEADYCGLQLTNFWSASPDWVNRQTSLSWCNDGSQAYQTSDGKYHFILSQKDPGVQNWIDATGHTQGAIYLRIQSPGLALNEAVKPVTRLVKLSELQNHIPADMPEYDAEARKKQLISRQNHARKRYQTW